jgi:hypothetical protein
LSGSPRLSSGRASITTATTSGMTSPARRTITVSPTRASRRATWSALCSVALVTTTPATLTGASRATGVIAPVRPTCTSMRLQAVGLFLRREFVRQRPARRARYGRPSPPAE